MWFTDEAGPGGLGSVTTGQGAALLAAPTVASPTSRGGPLRCQVPITTAWARVRPSLHLFGFDGYQWLRAGVPVPGATGPVFASSARATVTCRVTVTYREPFLVTASATS
jgi:hypothetical protein